jgi:phage portal protein BeeE
MLRILRAIGDEFNHKGAASANDFVGFTGRGEVVLRDRRGTLKPKFRTLAKRDLLAAVTRRQEVANIQFRLYKVSGNDQQEVSADHPILTLLDGVNEHMTGPELKYVTMAHLELTGNFYWLLDGVKNDTDKPRARASQG